MHRLDLCSGDLVVVSEDVEVIFGDDVFFYLDCLELGLNLHLRGAVGHDWGPQQSEGLSLTVGHSHQQENDHLKNRRARFSSADPLLES